MFLDKFCDNCGGKLTKEAEVCPHCGTKLKVAEKRLCNQCGAELAVGQIYCGQCGIRYDEIHLDEDSTAKIDDIAMSKDEGLSDDDLMQIIEMDEGYQTALADYENYEDDSSLSNDTTSSSINLRLAMFIIAIGLGAVALYLTVASQDHGAMGYPNALWEWYTYDGGSNVCIMLFVVAFIAAVIGFCTRKE